MRAVFFIVLLIIVSGCGKKAVEINFGWAQEWQYVNDTSQTVTIEFNGYATYNTKHGKYKGYARIRDNYLIIGTKKSLIKKHPVYYSAPLSRWEMEIDDMLFLRY